MNRKEIHLVQESFRELIKSIDEQLKVPFLSDDESVYLTGVLQGYQHGYELVRKLK
tara:strand:- start:1267 stop:1434 length:168 start_codon:yes stop_codon:yes gene_type:complete